MRKNTHQLFILTVVLLVFVSVPTVIWAAQNKASEVKKQAYYQVYYIEIVVKPGETFESLVQPYCEQMQLQAPAYIKEVKKVNLMRKDALVAGEHMILPMYR